MSDERTHREGAGVPDPRSGLSRAEISAWFTGAEESDSNSVVDAERDHDLDELFARFDQPEPGAAEPGVAGLFADDPVAEDPPVGELFTAEPDAAPPAVDPTVPAPLAEEPLTPATPAPGEPAAAETPAPPAQPGSLAEEPQAPGEPAAAATPEADGGLPRGGPGAGLSRSQLIAMGVGVAITLAGAGWALAAPGAPASAPTSVPSPTPDAARVAAAIDAIDQLSARVTTAKSTATAFAAPLAALQGASDEAARAAAETARQAYEGALAAVVVPGKPGRNIDAAALAAVEKSTADAGSALDDASMTFHAAISVFIGTMPGYSVTAVAANSDGSAELRDAVTRAASAMASSDPFTPPGFAPWDRWRAALAALIADATGTTDTTFSDEPAAPPSAPPDVQPSAPPSVVDPPSVEPSPEPNSPDPTSPPPAP
ncbi:hypothetical protein [Microbacterium sp. USTB-Y]|uniref:hypothetical protein n=1 Tax=Microbacterium sp. USTB-Y TaxID=2823692 RepID=UPI00203E6687|nr:hypothetical protein [Microbacterium sp. USTB-Y]